MAGTEGTETPIATEPGNTEELDKIQGKPENEGVEPDKVEGEQSVVDHAEIDGEGAEELLGEHLEGEHVDKKEKILGDGEQLAGEEMLGEHVEGEEPEDEKALETEDAVEEEQPFLEEPPPDPAAPFYFSDFKEAKREPFELRPDQLAEVETLWELYQNYTPAYTDLDNFITEKELFYMLKALLLMTYTPEQFQEVIEFCVKPPHPEGHITYEQFLKIVTIRQRDFLIEDELRSALQVYDPDKTGLIDREYLKETLSKEGYKMPQKQLENLIKEVDMSNDGTIGIEDVVGTMCIDLNPEDLQMLRETLNPNQVLPRGDDDL